MTLSNIGLVLASWSCACSGFTVVNVPAQVPRGACWDRASGGDGGVSSCSGHVQNMWPTERHSRPLRRRRPAIARNSGMARRGAQGGAGEPAGNRAGDRAVENADMVHSKDTARGDRAEAAREASSTGASKGTSKNALMAQMVKAAGQRQHWKEAIVMFDKMQEEGVPPVKAAYAAALRACAKGAEWERSTQLLDNYVKEGYALDDGVVSAAVKACCRAGRPSEAEAILAKSLAEGLVPEVSLYAAVMNACYTVGDMDAILSLGDQLRAQTLTPDHTAYHLMVTSHISKLDWVRATESLVEMGEAGLAPSAKSARQWRLASAAIEEIDIELGEDSYPHREEEGFEGGAMVVDGPWQNDEKTRNGGSDGVDASDDGPFV